MSQERTRLDKPIDGNMLGWFKEIIIQFQLAWRLFADPRISWGYKLIPILALAYVISPLDLLPDVVLGLGQLDDLAILLIGLNLFINFCPSEVVEEHQHALHTPREEIWTPESGQVIDVEPQNPAKEEAAS